METCSYSIIRYIPDLVKGEQINIGVIAFNDDKVRASFTDHWSFVKHFAGQDLAYIKKFKSEFEAGLEDQMDIEKMAQGRTVTSETVEQLAQGWMGDISFSTPKPAEGSPEEVLDILESQMLRTAPEGDDRARAPGKGEAAHTAQNSLKNAVAEFWSEEIAEQTVQYNKSRTGHAHGHDLDVEFQNSRPLMAVNGLSFRINTHSLIEQHIRDVLFAAEDLERAGYSDLDLAVCHIPPERDLPLFEQAKEACSKLDIEFVQEDQFDPWVNEKVREFEYEEFEHVV
ncbi:MAG: DUF3037 domain-containing protein [Bradymonadaceae bacterium]